MRNGWNNIQIIVNDDLSHDFIHQYLITLTIQKNIEL